MNYQSIIVFFSSLLLTSVTVKSAIQNVVLWHESSFAMEYTDSNPSTNNKRKTWRKDNESDDENSQPYKYSTQLPLEHQIIIDINNLTNILTLAWQREENETTPLFIKNNQNELKIHYSLNPRYEASVRQLHWLTSSILSDHNSFRRARFLLKKIWAVDPLAGAHEAIIPFS